MAWPWRFLTARPSQDGRAIAESTDALVDSTQVAILGALHVNGVARLLKDPSGYGEGKAGTWWTDDMIEAKPE